MKRNFRQMAFCGLLLASSVLTLDQVLAQTGVIAENAKVQSIDVIFFGPDGLPHTVSVPKDMYKTDETHVEAFDSSSIPGLGKTEKADMKAIIDRSTEVVIPSVVVTDNGNTTQHEITDGQVGMVVCNLSDKGNQFSSKCARSQLAQKMQELKEKHGAVFITGIELEYFLFDKSQPGNVPVDNAKYMSQNNNPKVKDFKLALHKVLKSVGIKYNKMHTEVAPSQEEVVLAHGPADKIADRLAMTKIIIKQVADAYGFNASFDPKPFKGENGSGMHTHFSLVSADGKTNLCAAAPGSESPYSALCEHFIAGILKYGPSLAAIFNPTPNSYLRTGDPEKEAPNKSAIGFNNRSCAIRIPMLGEIRSEQNPSGYHPMESRAEFRYSDLAVNPYSHTYALLAAGMKGIEDKLPLPKIVKGINLFDYVKKGPEGLAELKKDHGLEFESYPQNLEEAYAKLVALRENNDGVIPNEFLDSVIGYYKKQMDVHQTKSYISQYWDYVSGFFKKKEVFKQSKFDYLY